MSVPATSLSSDQSSHSVMSCPTCGQNHLIEELDAGEKCNCTRCGNPLLQAQPAMLQKALAFTIASLVLFLPAQILPLLNFDFSGQWTENIVLTGAFVLWQQGDALVGLAVIFIGFLAPLLFNLCLLGAVLGIQTKRYNRLARKLWTLILELGEWSMLDVYLIALGVSAIKLLGMGEVATRPGLWFVFGFVFTTALTTSVIRPAAIRNLIRQQSRPPDPEAGTDSLSCHHCGTIAGPDEHECRACFSTLHELDVSAMKSKIIALLVASVAFWIPANFLPVMTITMVGHQDILTVLGGVEYLWHHGDILPAIIIFAFSMVIPISKIITLFLLLWVINRPLNASGQTRVYQIVQTLGRWSMVDICVVSILAALGQLGVAATVTAGPAALPFCIVVVLTIFAANSFDTRVFWSHLGQEHAQPLAKQAL
ncbi:MAG: paraquat-inducible protein A [Verrucomicrobiota bacterium]